MVLFINKFCSLNCSIRTVGSEPIDKKKINGRDLVNNDHPQVIEMAEVNILNNREIKDFKSWSVKPL